MQKKYKEWIDNYEGSIFRRCKKVSEEMKEAFPELIICKGMVQIIENKKWYQHQWLKNSEGEIIDPTAKQWEKIIDYKEIGKDDLELVGICPECGEWVYGEFVNQIFCSESCCDRYTQYIRSI